MSRPNFLSPPLSAKRILAVCIGGLGDTILFSPVFKAVRSRYPKAHIELLLASPLARLAFAPAKEIDHLIVANTASPFPFAKAAALLPFSLRSRLSGGFDLGVFATGLNTKFVFLLKILAGIRRVICAPKPPEYDTDLSCNMALASLFDPDICEGHVFFPLTNEALEEAREHLNIFGITWDHCDILAVYPSRDLPHRPRWPLGKLVQVITLIKERGFSGKVVVVGSPEEGKEWDSLDSSDIADANLAGKISISAVGALLANCALALGNDGGIMHVAGAVGCPLVVLMTTAPASYRPAGERVSLLMAKSAGYASCLSQRVKEDLGGRCADNIEVDNVVAACLDQLAHILVKS